MEKVQTTSDIRDILNEVSDNSLKAFRYLKNYTFAHGKKRRLPGFVINEAFSLTMYDFSNKTHLFLNADNPAAYFLKASGIMLKK